MRMYDERNPQPAYEPGDGGYVDYLAGGYHQAPPSETLTNPTLAGTVTVLDGVNFTFGASAGTQFGTSTASKIAFWGATPISRPTALTAPTGEAPAGGTGTAAGGWDTAAHRDTAIAALNNAITRINELENKLKSIGLIA